MTTLYIAGPMTGHPDFNYPAFNANAGLLRGAGYDVLNPVDSEHENPTPGAAQAWDWYMRRALRMLTHADGIATLDGWESSRGASLEVYIAAQLKLPIRPALDWTVMADA